MVSFSIPQGHPTSVSPCRKTVQVPVRTLTSEAVAAKKPQEVSQVLSQVAWYNSKLGRPWKIFNSWGGCWMMMRDDDDDDDDDDQQNCSLGQYFKMNQPESQQERA